MFIDRPAALFEVFHFYQQNPQIHGIRANTLRYIAQSLYLIDDEFRQDQQVKNLFLGIFKHKNLVFKQLKLMNALGVLGAYLPVFERIVGRMQYDLFHMYTVDQHTLFVLRNIRKIFLTDKQHKLAHEIATKITTPYVLNLAGFFHDIAKGRGGDHAELGAHDAQDFSHSFQLPHYDGRLLAWLVKHHLIMSVVAQKQDLSDPNVIAQFSQLVGNQNYLDHLYVLTVADICGTDPKLWNSYKDSLLQELYIRTVQHLSAEKAETMEQSKTASLLHLDPVHHSDALDFWGEIPDRFFIFSTPKQIATISQAIIDNSQEPTVSITDLHDDGFEFMFYGLDKIGLFHQVVEVFAEYHFNVASARIYTAKTGHVMDYFHCLGEYDEEKLLAFKKTINQVLNLEHYHKKNRELIVSRRDKLFTEPPVLKFSLGSSDLETRFEIICADYRGLLVNLTQIFLNLGIDIHAAKIGTFGHRAEDVFWLSKDDLALSNGTQNEIKKAITGMLDEA